jgi:hypothetical protein
MRRVVSLIASVVCLCAQEIAPICAPKSKGLSFNCWRDKARRDPAADSGPVSVRSARDVAADVYGAPFPLDEPGAKAKLAERGMVIDRLGEKNPFPSAASDLVAVVTFSDFVPRISQSHRSVYTELIFKVNDVLKQSAGRVANGESITSILPGAALLLDNGKTLRYFPEGGDDLPLRPGGRYLVFLKYRPQTDTFDFIKHWELKGGRLVITDLVEMEKAARGNPSIRPDTREGDIVEQIRQGKL